MGLLEDKTQYDNMVKTLGPDHPDTLNAKKKLRETQMGIASGITSVATTGMSVASEFIDPNNADGTLNTNKEALKTGLQTAAAGATAGAAFGPIGSGVGAAVGFIGGSLFGKNKARVENARLERIKTREDAKKFTKSLSLNSDKEDAMFNANKPQYLAKGGTVKGGGDDDLLNKKGRERDTALRKAQEKLTLALQKKYPNIPMADFIKQYAADNYDANKLEEYSLLFEKQYGKTYLTPEEMQATLGKEEYAKYQNNLKDHISSKWGSNKNVKGELEQAIADESTAFGPRHMMGRYAWNNVRNGGGPYGAMNSKEFNPSGRVFGKEGVDVNDANVKSESFVIPATNNPELKDTVKKIARIANIDKPLVKSNDKGDVNVKLSNDELVIAPEKVNELEQSGIDLNAVKDSINAEKKKGTKMKSKRTYLTKFDDGGFVRKSRFKPLTTEEERKLKEAENLDLLAEKIGIRSNAKFLKRKTTGIKMDKKTSKGSPDEENSLTKDPFKSENNGIFDKITAGLQTVGGIAGVINNERAYRRNLREQQKVAETSAAEEAATIHTAAVEKKAAIEIGFKDTRNTIERLRRGSMKDLAKNSLTASEFSQNYSQTAAALADKVGDANNQKTSQILNIKGDATSQLRDVIRSGKQDRLNVLSSENELNAANMTKSALLQKAGIDNMVSSIKQERNERIRKRKMNQLLQFAKENNISLRQLGYITDEDVANLGGN